MSGVTLEDKFTLAEGRIFVSGPQAVVRLMMEQAWRDQRAGLKTGGFISGYRGSPLGGLDTAFWSAQSRLDDLHIKFVPGVNEEAAATACNGAQHVREVAGSDYDGVFALWYGKGPGVDRAGDALKHGNFNGASRHGGVLVLAGDDQSAKSSTTAHQSEQALAAFMMPILYPANVQEYVDFGLLGIAMSRYTGLWIALKCVNDTADATATIEVGPERAQAIVPDFTLPPGGLNARVPDNRFDQERRIVRFALPAAQAFARANGIDRVVLDSPRRRLGIVTSGRAYLETLQALRSLGIDDARAAELGIGLYKLGLIWPVEPIGLKAFALGHEELLVVEDKRAFVEMQLRDTLYDLPDEQRPRVCGKFDPSGAELLQSELELNQVMIAAALARRISALGLDGPGLSNGLTAPTVFGGASGSEIARTPFYCSGCPHNTSTRVLPGAVTLGGIGCHSLAMFMPDRPTAQTMQMGGEGTNWIGMAPFANTKHVFQNLGDGTYFHSGLLAIRAAVAARVNITYKLLFNDAVALTGGQPVDGPLNVPDLTFQLWSEGVARVVVVADEPSKYPRATRFAPGTTVYERGRLDEVQKELQAVEGVTVLIYDQVCAAEKRRRRKRGTFPDPAKRVVINELVCEGCGDCSAKSNCVSVQPKETPFGRKRQIDQSSCNKDFSCLQGFCPSFVTVTGASIAKPGGERAGKVEVPPLPAPRVADVSPDYAILVTGIGGTGVVTVGAILGMAAHIEGKASSVMDMTGLSQKNGAVLSHVRIAPRPEDLLSPGVGPGQADLLLACDLIVAGAPEAFAALRPGHTAAVLNTEVVAPSAFVHAPDLDLGGGSTRLLQRIAEVSREGGLIALEAGRLATAALGDSIATNFFMVGVASQAGRLPVSLEALEAAVRLNGVAVELNLAALQLGRWAAHDLEAARLAILGEAAAAQAPETAADMVQRRVDFLTAYQDGAYAERYLRLVRSVEAAELKVRPGETALTRAVARQFFRLMAYKDEYEVARLLTDPAFQADLGRTFKGRFKLTYHLAPPILAPKDRAGRPTKLAFGGWLRPGLRLLARGKALRHTPFDIFGYTAERRAERRLIADYEADLAELIPRLSTSNHAAAVRIAAAPEQIRGYGYVKAANLQRAEVARSEAKAAFERPRAAVRTSKALAGV